MAGASVDISQFLMGFAALLLKYAIEGLAVGGAMALISHKIVIAHVITVALVAMAVFALLDFLAPGIAMASRNGAGLGLGFSLVGFPGL